MHHAFASENFEVLFARDGVYGEELFFDEEPDCVIADVLISGKSGTDLALSIKSSKEGQYTPFILTSPQFRKAQFGQNAESRWKIDKFFNDPYNVSDLVKTTKGLIVEYKKIISGKPETDLKQPEVDGKQSQKSHGASRGAEEKTADVIELPVEREKSMERPIIDGRDGPLPETKTFFIEKARRGAKSVVEKEEKKTGQDDIGDALAKAAKEAVLDLEDGEVFGDLGKPKPKSAPSFKTKKKKQDNDASRPSTADSANQEPGSILSVGLLAAIPEKGDLQDIGVAEIIANVFVGDISGTLNLENEAGGNKTIYFKRGIPVYAQGVSRDETLGRVLVKHGIISEETAYLSLQNMAGVEKKQGGVLLEMGAITPIQLYQGLKLQIREKILNSFSWSKGPFVFLPDQIDTSSLTVFEIDPVKLIIDGVNQNFHPEIIRTVLNLTKDASIDLRWSGTEISRCPLTEDAMAILGLVNGKRSTSEIITKSGINKIKAGVILYTLWILGALEQIKFAQEAKPQAYEKTSVKEKKLSNRSEALDGIDDVIFPEPGLIDDLLDELSDESDHDTKVIKAIPEKEDLAEIDVPPEKPFFDKTPETVRLPSEPLPEDEESLTIRDVAKLDAAFKDLEEQLEERRHGKGEEGISPFFIKSSKSTLPELSDSESEEQGMSLDDKNILDEILTSYLALEDANYYQVMGLDQKATSEEIKNNYREIVKKLHSDKLRDRFDDEVIEKANAIVARVAEAFTTLGDPKRRKDYNKLLTPDGIEARERHISHILLAEHQFTLGATAAKKGEWESAKAHFQLAVEGFPEEAVYHTELAWAIYKSTMGSNTDRVTRATKYLEKAIKINPKSDKPYYYLGSILWDNGYKDKAARMFAQAFRYNRKNLKAQNALRVLQMEKEQERKEAAKVRREKEGKGNRTSVSDILKKEYDLFSIFRKKK